MYLPHSREETPDQMGTAGRMPGENELLLAEKLGAWEGGVDRGSHGKDPMGRKQKMALEGCGMKSCPREVTEALAPGPQMRT